MAHDLERVCSSRSKMAHNRKRLCHLRRTTLIAFAHNPFAHNPRAQAFTLGAQLRTSPAHKTCAQSPVQMGSSRFHALMRLFSSFLGCFFSFIVVAIHLYFLRVHLYSHSKVLQYSFGVCIIPDKKQE